MLHNLSAQHGLTILLFFIFASLTACGTSRRIEPTMAAESSASKLSGQDRIEIFEDVWKTINEQYYDPSFHGVNWQEVHDRYRPRIEAAKDDTVFYSLFEVMLAELRDAHTVFSHPRSPADNSFQPTGSVGISLVEAEGKTVILKVEPDSDAALAGVKPGMILRTVNGRAVEELYAEIRSQFAGSSTEQAMKDVMHGAILYGGFLGASRTFGIEDFDGKTFQVPITHFGARPSESSTLLARRLPSGYGYIKFDGWKPPVDEQFKAEMAKLMDTPGLIVDLRGNGGGQTDVLLNISSIFFQKEVSFGGFKKGAALSKRYSRTNPTRLTRKQSSFSSMRLRQAHRKFLPPRCRRTLALASSVGRRAAACLINGAKKRRAAGRCDGAPACIARPKVASLKAWALSRMKQLR